MYTEFTDETSWTHVWICCVIQDNASCLNGNQQKFPLSMIIGLNNQRRSCKLKWEKSEFSRTCIMKKEKKGLLRKMIFFMTYRSWNRKGTWEKFAYSFIYGFCFISPKTISLRRNKTHEMLSTNLVSSRKTSDARYCQFSFWFHCCF